MFGRWISLWDLVLVLSPLQSKKEAVWCGLVERSSGVFQFPRMFLIEKFGSISLQCPSRTEDCSAVVLICFGFTGSLQLIQTCIKYLWCRCDGEDLQV